MCSDILQNSTDSIPTSNLVCIKMEPSRDRLTHTFRNHYEVIILSMKPLARLKDRVKSCTNCLSTNSTFIDCSKAY